MSVQSWLRPTESGVSLAVRVTPRAAKTVVGPIKDGRLAVRVTAPPVDHAANDATVLALAKTLGVPRRAVQIARGLASRNKIVDVIGVTSTDVERALGLGG